MKLAEKAKAQKVLDKILNDDFDENDLESILIRLRPYSGGLKVFREAADFVAHNDLRDQGLINKSLDSFYLSWRFWKDYAGPKKELDMASDFPAYIKGHLLYQAMHCDDAMLKRECGVTVRQATDYIRELVRKGDTPLTCKLKEGKISNKKISVFNYLLSFISVQPVFSSQDFMREFVDIIKAVGLNFEEAVFIERRDKLVVFFSLLIHLTEFKITGEDIALCYLRLVPSEVDDRDADLSLFAECNQAGLPGAGATYEIFKTGLSAGSFLGEEVLTGDAMDGVTINLRRPLHFVNGKIVPI
jgi:hypothetical protein